MVAFLVDTGADLTVLHAHDAARLIPGHADGTWKPSQLQTVGGIGGTAEYGSTCVQLLFTDEDGHITLAEQPVIVALPGAGITRSPSLLGHDVLNQFRVTVDARSGTVTLER
ncbi:MAG: hypothetical protein DWG83_00900 [Chloroflexi bacterium]|nr:aspartyl protease family protein [Chloroflexota bacterium]MDA1240867.1 aspartyl protease family protein [Chloroflexota bacterium]MQC19118.1 hypothetical protein [Chloroflexota bacterium]